VTNRVKVKKDIETHLYPDLSCSPKCDLKLCDRSLESVAAGSVAVAKKNSSILPMSLLVTLLALITIAPSELDFQR